MTVQRLMGFAEQIESQLTPPKPRPEEPKGYGVNVKAKCTWTHDVHSWEKVLWGGEAKWMTLCGNALMLLDYLDLIDPVVLSPGQVK